jgi:hypothetical protein
VILIQSPGLFRIIGGKFTAMAMFPFVFVRDKRLVSQQVRRHEAIHFRQQIELLIVFFYPIYVIEFAYHWVRTRKRDAAYRSISFEREAFAGESDPDYLRTRPLWAMWRFKRN